MKTLRPIQPLVVEQGSSDEIVTAIMEAVHEVQLARAEAARPKKMERVA